MKKLICALVALTTVISSAAMAASKDNLKIAGSTTVLPLAQIWAEEYMAKHPGKSISVSGGGTGTGISMLLNGTCDIASASREAKSKEVETARSRNSKLVATKLAKDGLAIIVHPSNSVKNLTIAQIAAIYSGKAESWKSVGGHSGGIVAVGRDSSSGTYGFFQDAVLGGRAYRKDMLSMPSNAAVAQAVSQSKDAIGYVGMAYAEEFEKSGKVKIISISRKTGERGMVPTDADVKNGSYPLFRYLYAYTMGTPRGLVESFLKFGLSEEGQSLVKKAGYVPVK